MTHEFGGPWTLVKLDLLERYLQFFNTALQAKPTPGSRFRRIYIDAFAGTGMCDIKLKDHNRVSVKGSATIAIEVSPCFDDIHLIDLNAKHIAELNAIKAAHPDRNINVNRDDANSALARILGSYKWRDTRGVLFLDPYGMAVDWQTIQRVAETQALDVWYLFPLSGTYRQAAKKFERVDNDKADLLDRVLGTGEWRTAFYEAVMQGDLIANETKILKARAADPARIAAYVHDRLRQVFKGWVSAPVMLPENGAPMFALFFAVSNPDSRAVRLSKKVADHLFSMLAHQKIGRSAGAKLGRDDLFG